MVVVLTVGAIVRAEAVAAAPLSAGVELLAMSLGVWMGAGDEPERELLAAGGKPESKSWSPPSCGVGG